jgi:hypothetical protein
VLRPSKSGRVTGLVVQVSGKLKNLGTFTLTVFGKVKNRRRSRNLVLGPIYDAATGTVMLPVTLRASDRTARLTIQGTTDADDLPLAITTFTLNVAPKKSAHT